ncbi:inositol monophosphatase family protein [Brytella acorum]|uniref:Inositol monophosphatase n=1 Tax=Brytella acorum TaxID=2959299 RepID=A0AA35XVW9_9PROT|nr:inositol monophosphatase family protein [Brytella acorum]MDF3624880.1 inositol monophosphatase [Brytella acorum]CAI9120185.1 inositol monophosphatase [Brytella acorum]
MTPTEAVVTSAELAHLVAIAREAARDVILPRFRRLGAGDVQTKTSCLDLVTIADEEAERLIAGRLRDLWPEAVIVGEEACSQGSAVRGALSSAPLAVAIDPIDGTSNFAAGVPLFAVMMAVVSYGQPIASVILDPISGEAAVALRGGGAWMDRDGEKLRDLRVCGAAPIERLTGKAAWRNMRSLDPEHAVSTLRRVAALWDFRCAAHEYLLTADGRGHFQLYTRSLPWDHLPGWLILHEAGGYGARLDGRPYDLASPEGGLLYAPDRATWHVLAEALALPLRD